MINISITEDGIKSYPIHNHSFWEIMIYLEGEGYLYTQTGNIPFKKGTIIIVPPYKDHGSVSVDGFKNISIGGNFGHMIFSNTPIVLKDNEEQDGEVLAKLIYKNKNSREQYINNLTHAYVSFLLGEIEMKSSMNLMVSNVISRISENAFDSQINISKILDESGYSRDYIRQYFKRVTGMNPTMFLTKIRIDRARFLIDVYGKTISLSQIAERCGYTDYVYFSKRFKQCVGVSPNSYFNELINNKI